MVRPGWHPPFVGVDDLSALRNLWDFAYTISATGGTWTARAVKDPQTVLSAASSGALLMEIRDHYYKRGPWAQPGHGRR